MTIKALIPLVMIGVLCVPAAARAQDEVIYFHTDAIGSVRATTNNSGAVQARYDYLPFGELWEADPPAAVEVRQFAGKEREKIGTHDLDYFGARYHLPVTGRFTTVDPVLNVEAAMTDPQRWNRYAYSVNRPFVMVDPDGRDPRLLTGGIGAAVYGAWKTALNVYHDRPWYENVHVEASKGFVVGLTLGVAAPALGVPSAASVAVASATASAVSTGSTAIGFAAGTGRSAFVADRLQHASRHLTEAGILGNWSNATAQRFVEMGTRVLENPTATFDHVLRGGEAVKGFLGTAGGRDVAFFVYKSGARAGQIATAVVPTADQLTRWGLF